MCAILEAKDDPVSAEQKWKKSYVDDTEVWFTLQNPTSDKFLTAISDESTIISGKLQWLPIENQ